GDLSFHTYNRSALDVLQRISNTGSIQCCRIGKGHVPVEPVDPNTLAFCHTVDPIALRQFTAPVLMIPIASCNPCAFGSCCCKTTSPLNKFLFCFCVSQFNGPQAKTAIHNMCAR